jgi:hypothetical protein
MKIEYKFAEIYAGYKTREEKNEIRAAICAACGYQEPAFWRRIRGESKEILVQEVLAWMQVTGKSFDSIVYSVSSPKTVKEKI